MATGHADRKVTMPTHASITLTKNLFVAALSDVRRFEQADLRELAHTLFHAGVPASEIRYEWRAGLRMITAGQQVRLSAEMRRLERDGRRLTIAA